MKYANVLLFFILYFSVMAFLKKKEEILLNFVLCFIYKIQTKIKKNHNNFVLQFQNNAHQ